MSPAADAARAVSHGAAEDDRTYTPAWLRAAPFLGKAPALTRRQWRVLGLVAAASLFDQYDLGLFGLLLKQIQHELAIEEHLLGFYGSIVMFGALPAFLLALAADRFGRRRLLLWTIVAYTLLTGATALAPNAQTYVVLQFLARTFISAEILIAVVVIAEEFDPEVRGWGIGALAALAACGHGLAALCFSLVNVLPFGWRALYMVGLAPLVLIAVLRRGLPETAHFERHRALRQDMRSVVPVLQPAVAIFRSYPGRAAALGAVGFLLALAGRAGGFFTAKYIQDAHGWSPGQLTALIFFGGFLGIFANTLAGRWSDRFGRRRLTILFLTLQPLLLVAFFNVSGLLLPLTWVPMIFTTMGGDILVRVFATELFPTSHRSTASGALGVLVTLGGAIGLAIESVLYGVFASHWTAISVLALVAFVAPLLVLATFPETSGRSLDEISPETVTP